MEGDDMNKDIERLDKRIDKLKDIFFKTAILLMMLIFLVSFLFFSLSAFKKTRIITERYTEYRYPTDFPLNAKITCEDGYKVERYQWLNHQTIYGCLEIINGKCSGEGKICLIERTVVE